MEKSCFVDFLKKLSIEELKKLKKKKFEKIKSKVLMRKEKQMKNLIKDYMKLRCICLKQP